MVSAHFGHRLQQRAVPDMIAALLLDHGARQRSRGAELVFLDKKGRRAIRRAVGGDRNMRIIERWLGVCLIVGDDGTLVTIAHRTRRVRRS